MNEKLEQLIDGILSKHGMTRESPEALETVRSYLGGRRKLPPTRDSVTHKFSIGGTEAYLIVGLDGRMPAEIFIKITKHGSTLSGVFDAWCRSTSLLLQGGMTTAELAERFGGMKFEPNGQTSNPDIPEATSVIDYVVRFITKEFAPCNSQKTDPPSTRSPA